MPAGFQAEGLAEPFSLETPYGKHSVEMKREGNEIVTHRSTAIRQVAFPVSEYPYLRGFFHQAKVADGAVFLLRRTTP